MLKAVILGAAVGGAYPGSFAFIDRLAPGDVLAVVAYAGLGALIGRGGRGNG